jgi:hypothetical protein
MVEQENIEHQETEDIQLAENNDIDEFDVESPYSSKRDELGQTKISKQTWSVRELINKIQKKELDLNPDYQRNVVWNREKQIAFIESLLMGIIVPPLYFVEIPGIGPLMPTKYEVVDGKQRLNSINEFVHSKFKLQKKFLEYYGDIYSDKDFETLSKEHEVAMEEFASQTLDIYVITAASPEFTKYDIFSRLNKGSAPLRVNEIRKAVYHSPLIDLVDEFVTNQLKDNEAEYKCLFSDSKIKRFEDYGIFYKAISFYISVNVDARVVEKYNSRPRELINNILASFQKKTTDSPSKNINDYNIKGILHKTIEILRYFSDTNYATYYLECCIKLAVDNPDSYERVKELIKEDIGIKETFAKSAATTSMVNHRINRVYSILGED